MKSLPLKLDWSEERIDEEEIFYLSPIWLLFVLSNFKQWGWVQSDYDETLNCYVLSFPEYSQLYVELFGKLLSEDDSKERRVFWQFTVTFTPITRMKIRIMRF